MLKRFLVLCLPLFLASVAFVPAAAAWAPAKGALFNNPTGSKASKYRIQLRVEKAIRNTPRGALILVSTYLMDRKASADALIGARRRGVHVHVIMDGGISTGTARRLKRVLNRDNGRRGRHWGPDDSFARQCAGSCRGGGPNQAMHAKFYAFSATGRARNVVMISSANLNKGGAVKGYNDMFTMAGVPKTFAMYHKVHDEMARDRVDGDPFVVQREGRFESMVFPKRGAKRGTDPTYRALNRVRCHGARGGAGRGGRTIVKVGMFHWSGNRGIYLAQKILALRRDGCIVSVIYGAPGKGVADRLRASARRGGINLYDSRMDRNEDGEVDIRIHSKYLLVNGNYNGDSSSWQVFAGSQNWTDCSLTCGDENTIHINSRPAYAAYSRNFDFVRSHGARHIRRATAADSTSSSYASPYYSRLHTYQ